MSNNSTAASLSRKPPRSTPPSSKTSQSDSSKIDADKNLSSSTHTPRGRAHVTAISTATGAAAEKEGKSKSVPAADLPLVSVLDEADFREAKSLLTECLEFQAAKEELDAAISAHKMRILEICRVYGLPGLRFGQIAAPCRFGCSRKTFNKGLAVELGCDPDILAAAYKESKSWDECRIEDLTKPRKNRSSEEE